MSFEGTIMNGTVVFKEPPALPDGTVVEVSVKAPAAGSTLGERLMQLAGIAKGMKEEAAVVPDHYVPPAPPEGTQPTLLGLLKLAGRSTPTD
jgi:hypothetical protein